METSALAADEGLRGRNVLFINSLLRPLLKKFRWLPFTLHSNEPLQHHYNQAHLRTAYKWQYTV